MFGNSCAAQAAKMADPSNTLSSLSGTNTGKPAHNIVQWDVLNCQMSLLSQTHIQMPQQPYFSIAWICWYFTESTRKSLATGEVVFL